MPSVNREITFYSNTLTYLLNNLSISQRGYTTETVDPNNESVWETNKGWLTFKDLDGDLQLLAVQKYYDVTAGDWVRRANVFADIEADNIYTEEGLQDQYLSAVMPISETGVTGLDGAFSATSIVGALNELKNDIVSPNTFWEALSVDTIAPKAGDGYDWVYVNDGLKDAYCSGIPLAESGSGSLDVGFSSTSIIGAINELLSGLVADTHWDRNVGGWIYPQTTTDHVLMTSTTQTRYNDTGTYISSKNDGYLDFDADGVFRFNTGNMGIGTTTPLSIVSWTGTTEKIVNVYSAATTSILALQGDPVQLIMADLGGAANDKMIALTCNDGISCFASYTDAGDSRVNNILVMDMGTGYVGINDAAPSVHLDVNGVINAITGFRQNDAATSGQYLRGNGTNIVLSAIQASDIATVQLWTRNVGGWLYPTTTTDSVLMGDDTWIGLGAAGGRMVFDSTAAPDTITFTDCNVGIGVVPQTWNTSYTALQIGGVGALFSATAAAANDITVLSNNVYLKADGNFSRILTDEACLMQLANGIFTWYSNGSAAAGTYTPTETMRLDVSGNLGLGCTPAYLAEIRGGLTTTGAILTLGTKETTVVANDVLGRINFYAPLEASGGDALLVGASIVAFAEAEFTATVNSTSLLFQTGASEAATTKMTLKSNGYLGIGAVPTYKFDVFNAAGTLSIFYIDDTTSNISISDVSLGSYITLCGKTGTAYNYTIDNRTGGYLRILSAKAGALGMYINGDGYVGIGPTTVDRAFHVENTTATTNAVQYLQRMTETCSGTVAVGFGVGMEYELEDESGTNRVAGTTEVYWSAVDNGEEACRTSNFRLNLLRDTTVVTPLIITEGSDFIVLDGASFGMGSGKATIAFNDDTTDYISFSNCNVGIGMVPECLLHIYGSAPGFVSPAENSLLCLENGSDCYISILTPAANNAGIRFIAPGDNDVGFITYSHGTETVGFGAGGSVSASMDKYGNLYLRTGGAVGTSGQACLCLPVAAEPSTSPVTNINIFAASSSDASATIGLRTERAVEAIGTFTASHKLEVKINGTKYHIQLDAV